MQVVAVDKHALELVAEDEFERFVVAVAFAEDELENTRDEIGLIGAGIVASGYPFDVVHPSAAEMPVASMLFDHIGRKFGHRIGHMFDRTLAQHAALHQCLEQDHH